jgi:hypothetical protein
MSKWKNTESWNRGQVVEVDFSKLLDKRNISWKKATRQQQFNHIDYTTSIGSIDVKAKKRISRSDSDSQSDFVWLEFKNVQGKKGWMCCSTDIIAFEREKDFVLFRRHQLLEWAMGKCDIEQLVSNSKDALYKGYTRRGRNDLISIVKMKDMMEIHHRIWQK